jgi:hypothetical protein
MFLPFLLEKSAMANVLFKDTLQYSGMFGKGNFRAPRHAAGIGPQCGGLLGKRGQVATEYLLITGFILAAVTLIFSYSYISNNQNIKVSQANTALDRLVNAADLVYALGYDNNQFVEIEFPVGTTGLFDITLCNNGEQGNNMDCSARGGAKLGALVANLDLLGGSSEISRGAKADIELDIYGDPPVLPSEPGESDDRVTAASGRQRVKVYWCGSKICFKRA